MSSPLVSVYIANHNYEKYITYAIESVLRQTYENIEIIIIDDGSTDNSLEVIERYRDIKNIIIINQNNKGLTVTNNIALSAATGEYIVRLDADDYFTDDAIEKLVTKIQSDENAAMVFGDWYYIDDDNNIIGKEERFRFSEEVTLYDLPAHGACTLFNREDLINVGGYDESLTCQDGYELWFRIIERYNILSVNEPIFYYRRHGSNLTSNEQKILKTRSQIFDKHARLAKKQKGKVVALFPIRETLDDNKSVSFKKIAGKYIFELSIEPYLKSSQIDKVIISTYDRKFQKLINEIYGDSVAVHLRTEESSRINTDIRPTVLSFFEEMPEYRDYEYLFVASVNIPLLQEFLISSAINYAKIFDVNTVVGVRDENSLFFKHDGSGLKKINDNSSFILEREKLYRKISGFNLYRIKDYLENEDFINQNVGHIHFDQYSSIIAKTALDLKIIEYLYNEPEHVL